MIQITEKFSVANEAYCMWTLNGKWICLLLFVCCNHKKNNGNGKNLSKEEKFKKNYGDYILNKTTKWHKKTNNEGHICCSKHYYFCDVIYRTDNFLILASNFKALLFDATLDRSITVRCWSPISKHFAKHLNIR